MPKYHSFRYGERGYSGPTIIVNTINQLPSIGAGNVYYADMLANLADEHVYPTDDNYIATVTAKPVAVTGTSGLGADITLTTNGTHTVTATADGLGNWTADLQLFEGLNTIEGKYHYVDDGGIPIYGVFPPIYVICNDIHLFLYVMCKQFNLVKNELDSTSLDSNLLYTRGERLEEIWGTKLNFAYDENVSYAQYRAILFGLTKVYLGGSTLANLKYALMLLANNPGVKIYEFWRDASKMVANREVYWQWNHLSSVWNGESYRWLDTRAFERLGLTQFGCQILFPIDNYTGPLEYASVAINLTRPAHLIYSLILWLTTYFPVPDNDVTYTLA